jgi:hypothetical protein
VEVALLVTVYLFIPLVYFEKKRKSKPFGHQLKPWGGALLFQRCKTYPQEGYFGTGFGTTVRRLRDRVVATIQYKPV